MAGDRKEKKQAFVDFQIEVEKALLSRGLDVMWAKQLVDDDLRYLEQVFNTNGTVTEAANEIFITRTDYEAEAMREKKMGQQTLISSEATPIALNISPQALGYLKQLTEIGLWGATAEEVAACLINRQLADMVVEGFITTSQSQSA